MVDRPIAFQELLQVSSTSRFLDSGAPLLRSATRDAIRHAFGVRNNGDRSTQLREPFEWTRVLTPRSPYS